MGLPTPEPGGVAGSVADALMPRVVAGAAGAAAVDATPDEWAPGDLHEYDERVVGALGALGVGPEISRDILRSHPRLAQWAVRQPRGTLGTTFGLLIGLGLVMGGKEVMDAYNSVAGYLFGGEDEGPAGR
jgi:hypothetical protein